MVAINRNSGYGDVLRVVAVYRPHALQNASDLIGLLTQFNRDLQLKSSRDKKRIRKHKGGK